MAAIPNLSGRARAGYVLVGGAACLGALYGVDSRAWRLVLLLIGGILIVEGVIGYCAVRRLFGRSSPTS